MNTRPPDAAEAATPRRSPAGTPLLLAGALLLFLSGCQSVVPANWRIPDGTRPAVVQDRSTLDADDPFAYVQHLLHLEREPLALEIQHRRLRVQERHLPLDRAKLALALTLPSQNQRDTLRAMVALTDVPRDNAQIGAPATAMLNYVEVLLAWQAKQEDVLQGLLQPDRTAGSPAFGTSTPGAGPADSTASLTALAQKLRAELKRNEGQVDTLSQRLREEKARADALQQKLDALVTLEKSLADRKAARPETRP